MTTTRWRIVLWVAAFLLGGIVAWQARLALLPFGLGLVLAYAATPLVDQAARLIPVRSRRADTWRRGFVVLVMYGVFIALLAGLGVWLLPLAIQQAVEFIEDLPRIVEEAYAQAVIWMEEYRSRVPIDVQTRIEGYAEDALIQLARIIAAAAQGAVGAVTGTIALLFGFLLVPFFMFFAMRDRHSVTESLIQAAPAEVREDVRYIGRMADFMLGRYIRVQLILAVVVGTSVGIGLMLMDVQLALALALWAGLTELIPIVGPWLGAIPALIIVAATQPDMFLWVALLYLGVQAAENYLLIPKLQSDAVKIHPAMVLLLLAVSGAIWGILGMLVVIPIASILREIFWYVDARLRGHTPLEAYSFSYVGRLRGARQPVPAAEEPLPDTPVAEEAAPGGSDHREEPAVPRTAARADGNEG